LFHTILYFCAAGLGLICGFLASPAMAQACDPNYDGACVPVSSDVDCAGGSGNGPDYVSGPVYIIGADIYELDRDGDGVACEK
jgi:resuscitation-promoting factor RpfB